MRYELWVQERSRQDGKLTQVEFLGHLGGWFTWLLELLDHKVNQHELDLTVSQVSLCFCFTVVLLALF